MKHSIRISDISQWLPAITKIITADFSTNDEVQIDFKEIPYEQFTPIHISSIACVKCFLEKRGIKCSCQHVPRPTLSISKGFNLWQLDKAYLETYSHNICRILKQSFYPDKDLSAVKGCLNEALYNVFDHAEAKDIAFICLSLDPITDRLCVAVCDLGLGIAKKIRSHFPEILNDTKAVAMAVENSFTTKSRKHNRGYGLDNILSCCNDDDTFKIISNGASYIAVNDKISTFALDYEFPGTLLYFEISIYMLPEDEDIFEEI